MTAVGGPCQHGMRIFWLLADSGMDMDIWMWIWTWMWTWMCAVGGGQRDGGAVRLLHRRAQRTNTAPVASDDCARRRLGKHVRRRCRTGGEPQHHNRIANAPASRPPATPPPRHARPLSSRPPTCLIDAMADQAAQLKAFKVAASVRDTDTDTNTNSCHVSSPP
jgi:hypothetical protein